MFKAFRTSNRHFASNDDKAHKPKEIYLTKINVMARKTRKEWETYMQKTNVREGWNNEEAAA